MKKIITSFLHPPIPARFFDWIAYFDGEEEGLEGAGATEAGACMVLMEKEIDRLEELTEADAKCRAALRGLVYALEQNDEDGLTEFAPQMQAARAALKE